MFGIIGNVGPWEMIFLLFMVIPLVAYCKTWAKAGYSWGWGLTMLIPVINIIGFCVLGFSKWPIEEELARVKANITA